MDLGSISKKILKYENGDFFFKYFHAKAEGGEGVWSGADLDFPEVDITQAAGMGLL